MNGPWTTKDELNYLDEIGESSDAESVNRLSKKELLQGYMRGLNRRRDFLNGAIDRRAIQDAVVRKLKACRA